MNDMSALIVPKSDQINADDLIAGPMTITIKSVTIKPGVEQPISIAIQGEKKVFRPCKSMCRIMVSCWGADASDYAGRSMTLYRDPSVKWGGMEVGGIRISHMSHIPEAKTLALTETNGKRRLVTVEKLMVKETSAPQTNDAGASQPAKPKRTIGDYVAEKLAVCKSRAEVSTLVATDENFLKYEKNQAVIDKIQERMKSFSPPINAATANGNADIAPDDEFAPQDEFLP